MKTALKIVVVATVLLVGLGSFMWQQQRGAKLRKIISYLQQEGHDARLSEIAASAPAETTPQIREAIERTRKEIAELERALQPSKSPKSANKAPFAPNNDPFTTNQDPEKGPVRVGYFRNVGQATPAAAFQTLIWALATDNEAVVSLLGISPAGREKLHAMVTQMAPGKQPRFHPPEKVVGMLLTFDLLKEDGFSIGEATAPDASGQAMLMVGRARAGRKGVSEKKLPFQRGPAGWQVSISDEMIDSIPGALESFSMYVPPKLPKK